MALKIGRNLGQLRSKALGISLIRLVASYRSLKTAARLGVLKLVGLDKSLHTWNGVHFGRRVRNILLTCRGIEVGHLYGNEFYSTEGTYLGELKEGRLITHKAKKSKKWIGFTPRRQKSCIKQDAQGPRLMHLGHEDFPLPDTFYPQINASAA